MADESEQQQALQQYQQIQQQMQQVDEYIDQMEANIENLNETSSAVEDLQDEELGSEVLAPIGSGVFAIGELQENDKVVVNVGGDAFEKRSVEGAQEVIDKKKNDFQETKEALNQTMQQLQQQMQQIVSQMQQGQE